MADNQQDSVEETNQLFNEWAQNFGEQLTQILSSVVNTLIPITKQIYETLYEQYSQAGAPYGDTQEGCLRWMEELAEVRKLENQIEQIVSRHQGLAYFRKRLAEKCEVVPERILTDEV